MVVVAVAGGTGGLGRTVLDAIAKAGEHKAIVLSRTVSSPMLSLQSNNVKTTMSRQQLAPHPRSQDVLLWIITTSSRSNIF